MSRCAHFVDNQANHYAADFLDLFHDPCASDNSCVADPFRIPVRYRSHAERGRDAGPSNRPVR